MRWPKYWSFSFNISPSNEHSGLIYFRMDWLDLLAVQGTLKSLLQHHSSKASILQHSAFFIVQLSHPHMTTGKTIALTRQTFVGKVMSLLFNMLSRLVAKSWTRLSDFTFTFHFHAWQKEMATHSSILAWWIPGTGAWWAAVSRVALSRTWLKRRSSNSSLEEKTNLDRILKFRDITLPTKVCLVKAVVFPEKMNVRVGL